MLRITLKSNDDRPVFRVEGRLIGPWVDELRRVCQSPPGPSPLLDLAAVSYADDAGVRLLHELLAAGAEIATCSLFLTALLNQESK